MPEPAEWLSGSAGVPADPADRVTLDESVSMAFLVVLESMTPAERVAFILHDVFGYPFAEIPGIVGRTPAACRQLASSGRRRSRAAHRPAAPTARQSALVRDFGKAWQASDIVASSPCSTRTPSSPQTAAARPPPPGVRSRAPGWSAASWPASPPAHRT